MRVSKRTVLGLSCALVLLGACGKDSNQPGEKLEVGQPAAAPFDSIFHLTKEIQLRAGRENPLGNSEDLVVLGGRIFVVDFTGPDIKVFDRAAGRLITTIGRAGNGPGEFRVPESATAVDARSFAVLDRARRIVSIWDTTGTLEREWPVLGTATAIDLVPGADRLIVAGKLSPTRVKSYEGLPGIHEFDLDGNELASYRNFPPMPHPWQVIFSALFATAVGPYVVSGTMNSNELHLYNRGTGEERWVTIAGPWYTPLDWPDPDYVPAGMNRVQWVGKWAKMQKLAVKLVTLDPGHYVTRFQTYDDDNLVFYYVVADIAGRELATSDSSPIKLVAGGDGVVQAVTVDSTGTAWYREYSVDPAHFGLDD